MQTIKEKKIRSTGTVKTPKTSSLVVDSDKVQIPSNAPNLMIHAMDSIFSNMRIHRVSMSSCHAIVKLYMAFTTKKELINLSSLASQLGVTTAAITSVADSMEKLGFAKRLVDPGDRRAVMISLTPRGMRFAESFGATGIAHQ
ncbi:MAG: MarR family [Verrucomicrobiota bacterium]